MTDMHAITVKVNGRDHNLVIEARRTLADMLRHDLGYTGTHLGCEHGICGACTVIMNHPWSSSGTNPEGSRPPTKTVRAATPARRTIGMAIFRIRRRFRPT